MQTEDLERIQALLRVTSRLSVAARNSFLERAEPRRGDLRSEVRSLLAHDTGRGELFAPALAVPETAGPYELLDRLGEAPPARLYRARLGQDAQRPVMIAVAGPSKAASGAAEALHDQAVRQRDFRDPAIARLLDAGTTTDNGLYLAFDAVEGVPLADLCDVLHLTVLERVELIEQAALAVERSHAAGIVPLGLVPWSILGTWSGDRPQVVIMAVDPWPLLALLEPESRAHGELLTGLEMSPPEALRGEARGVLSDVFALGALLFEAASGTHPIGLERLAGHRSLREELRRASRTSPPLASERLTGLGSAVDGIARLRSTDSKSLKEELRGGLDAIIARALAPLARDRQPSAGAFAAELSAWRSRRGRGLLGAVQRLGRRLGEIPRKRFGTPGDDDNGVERA